MESTGQRKTVRELVAELAELEDGIRQARATAKHASPGVGTLSPELLELVRRERQVIAALRRYRPEF